MQSSCLFSVASSSAVSPALFFGVFGSTQFCSRTNTHSAWPLQAAACSGVSPRCRRGDWCGVTIRFSVRSGQVCSKQACVGHAIGTLSGIVWVCMSASSWHSIADASDRPVAQVVNRGVRPSSSTRASAAPDAPSAHHTTTQHNTKEKTHTQETKVSANATRHGWKNCLRCACTVSMEQLQGLRGGRHVGSCEATRVGQRWCCC